MRRQADARKQEEENRKKAINDNKLREQNKLLQNRQAMTLCFEADALMFEPNPDLRRVVELYKKSEQLGNPKAMMALGRIYE